MAKVVWPTDGDVSAGDPASSWMDDLHRDCWTARLWSHGHFQHGGAVHCFGHQNQPNPFIIIILYLYYLFHLGTATVVMQNTQTHS